jgi:hypothetical protein
MTFLRSGVYAPHASQYWCLTFCNQVETCLDVHIPFSTDPGNLTWVLRFLVHHFRLGLALLGL